MRPNDFGRTRVGYAVGRRVGGAVVRNRVRRRLRALIDELLIRPVPLNVPLQAAAHRSAHRPVDLDAQDIVVTAFVEAATAPFEALRRDLASALRAAGVACEPTPAGEPTP